MRELPLVEVHHGGVNCVSRVPIFARLDPKQQEAVASFARPIGLARGELLHAAGDAIGQLFVVHSGKVKLVHTSASGRQQLLRVAGPGDVMGEHAFLTGARPDHHAEAVEDARLCVFAHDDLARLVGTYPTIALSMLRALSERAVDAERRVALGAVDVPVRVAGYLLDLPADDAGTYRVRLPLAKKDVASYLGTTPESFSRALAKLQRDGLVAVAGDLVELRDPDGLDALASR